MGKCYLVTEFVDGADLRQVIQAGGALPPEGVAVVGARVADALEFIHAHALFHPALPAAVGRWGGGLVRTSNRPATNGSSARP